MKKILKINKYLIILLITFLTSLIYILDFNVINGIYYENSNETFKFLTYIYQSMKPFETIWLFLFGFIFYFNNQTLFNKKTDKIKRIFAIIMSIILTAITIIGKSLAINNSLYSIHASVPQLIKIIIISIGYICLYYSSWLYVLNLELKNIKKKPQNKLEIFFDKNNFLINVIFILICWLPIIIIYYPGVASGDTLDCLAQFFGKPDLSWSARDIVLINKNVILNKHHSVLFTIILGSIVQIGEWISTYTFGCFIYVIIQCIILSLTFSYVLNYLKNIKIPFYFRISFLLFYAICPIVSYYAIALIKDTYGALLILIYNLFLLQIIRNYDVIKNKKFIIIFMLVILLTAAIKSNGFLIIIFSYFCFLIYHIKNKNRLKKLLLIGLVPIILFLGYDKVLLPSLDVTGTNKKEAYSIPFMQIARLIRTNEDGIEYEDKKTINKVLVYPEIQKNYNPDIADPVKNTYNKNVTEKELKDFWKVYFKYFKKYPKTYIIAFINSTYAYFFPEVGETTGILEIDYRLGLNHSFKINNSPKFYHQREILNLLLDITERLPFFSLFNHVAIYDWLLILTIMYIIKKKNFKYLIPLTSLTYIFLSCLTSPLNGSFRYILTIVFSTPLIISIIYLTNKESRE